MLDKIFRHNTDDPLLKCFLEKYSLNLLSIPRENASVGDLVNEFLHLAASRISFLLRSKCRI